MDGRREQRDDQSDLGGTMRLGGQEALLLPGTRAREIYQAADSMADNSYLGKNYRKYIIRLFWRSHYIQKLETEWELEFRAASWRLLPDSGFAP